MEAEVGGVLGMKGTGGGRGGGVKGKAGGGAWKTDSLYIVPCD